jgi:2-methylcitrate dehydratase PrpD
MQPSIDGILKLKNEEKIEADDVKKVTIGILRAGFPIIVYPEDSKYRPATTYGAQFSMPFGAALALSYGDVSLDRFNEENLHAKRILDLASRVQCVENPEIEKLYPNQWAATVKIETKDGASYSTRVDYPKGDPENRLTWDELTDKARKLMDAVRLKAKTAELMASIQELEKEGSISALTAGLMAE